jgi:hypothetical protein
VEHLKRVLRTAPALKNLRLPSNKLGPVGASALSVFVALDKNLVVLGEPNLLSYFPYSLLLLLLLLLHLLSSTPAIAISHPLPKICRGTA